MGNNQPEVVKTKKKHYWWRYLLVFFFGFFVALGSLVGGVYIAANVVTAAQIVSLTGQNPDNYLTEEYKGKTILSIIQGIVSGDTKFNNLSDISKITPLADDLLDKLNTTLQTNLGITIDFNALENTSWENIGSALITQAKEDITVASILKVTSTSPKLLQYLAFHKKTDSTEYDYDNPINISYLLEHYNDLLNSATLNDLLDVGTEGLLYNLKDYKLMSLKDTYKTIKINELLDITEDSPVALKFLGNYTLGTDFGSVINNAKISDLLDVGTEGILFNLKDVAIGNFAETVKAKNINQIISITTDKTDPNYSKALVYIGNYTSSNVGEAINNATIGDLFDVGTDTTTPLYNLWNKKISELDSNLKLGDVIKITSESNIVLRSLKNERMGDLSTSISALTIDQVIEFETDPTKPGYSAILNALKNRNATLSNLSSVIEQLTINEVISEANRTAYIFNAIGDCTLSNLGDTINGLKLNQVMEIGDSSSPVLKALQNVKINAADMSAALDNMTLGTLLNVTSSSPQLLIALQDKKLSELDQATINNLKLSDVLDTATINSSKILKSLIENNITIGNIGTGIESLKLEQIIDIDTATSPQILISLKDKTLSKLSGAIDDLTVGQVFKTDEISGSAFLKTLPSTTKISEIGTAIENLSFTAVFKEQVYELDGVTLKGTWSYLLDDPTISTDTPSDYKLNGTSLDKMMSNMQKNISAAKLSKLQSDLFLDSTLDLTKLLNGKALGDYTFNEIISYLAS